jgi:hypothetical protein
VRLDPLELTLAAPVAANLRGTLDAGAAMAVALAGELPAWPATWPKLPLPPPANPAAPIAIAFNYREGTLRATLGRGDEAIDATLAPGDFAAWRADPDAPLLPPLDGTARAERLQFGGVELRGVELRVGEDDAAP